MKSFFLVSLLLMAWPLIAATHFPHPHEDLFDEDEIQLGFKVGPQLTRYSQREYTDHLGRTSDVEVEPGLQYLIGPLVRFIYELPQLEFSVLWNVRNWPYTEEQVYSLSLPVLLKFPFNLGKLEDLAHSVEILGGFGYQPDIVLSGPSGHLNLYSGLLLSLGLTADFEKWLLNFEIQYNYVFNPNISRAFRGGKPQDLQIFLGPLWHF